jgi:predicted O-linked N-acetylglucosamine transferase (SPINDLY family)
MAPTQAAGWINAGHAVRDVGEWEVAAKSYRRALALAPNDALAQSEAIHADLQIADWRSLASRVERLRTAIECGGTVPPFHLLALDLPPSLKRANAERWCERYGSSRRPPRARAFGPLRLGYLSGDFRGHAVAYEVVELIERHQRNGVSLFGYGWRPDDGSDVRRRLDRAFGGIVDLTSLDDAAAAERIEADGIDVLIDLAGHTHGARPGVTARRPAPVQVSYFGFPGTSGASFHDYAFVDEIVAPRGHDALFREALVRLPGCYWPHDSTRATPGPASRAGSGLPADGVVLACFNQVYKIQPHTFGLWMRVLREAPGSILWLLASLPVAADNIRRAAAAAGVQPSRIVFAPQRPLPAHLARLRLADLVVDTLPYNAHTTASDALAVGCPVVTRIGADFAGRVGASMLTSIGCDDLVATTDDAFVDIVAGLARNADRRQDLRERLHRRISAGPLFDTGKLSRAIESAAEEMRRRSAAGEAPMAFEPDLIA